MRFKVTGMLLLALAGTAVGYLVPYEVQPVKPAWSGSTDTVPPNNWVGQTVTCCWDSMAEVHVFVGSLGADPAVPFKAEVREHPEGERIAYNDGVSADRDHVWLTMPLTPEANRKFVRGKEYIVRVTRPDSAC